MQQRTRTTRLGKFKAQPVAGNARALLEHVLKPTLRAQHKHVIQDRRVLLEVCVNTFALRPVGLGSRRQHAGGGRVVGQAPVLETLLHATMHLGPVKLCHRAGRETSRQRVFDKQLVAHHGREIVASLPPVRRRTSNFFIETRHLLCKRLNARLVLLLVRCEQLAHCTDVEVRTVHVPRHERCALARLFAVLDIHEAEFERGVRHVSATKNRMQRTKRK